ncbi:MAG: exodeoxyribonuclease VII large subunit [bacterium]
MPENILTVTQLTREIKKTLETSLPSTLKVTGEISNWVRSSSGHTYFSLKDETALIKCAVWKSTQLKREFRDGEKVILTGHISLYEPQGSYQIIVRSMEISGQGELYAQFLKIKEKLEKEGLFDANKKKKLPLYPLSIGIITSPTGSVIQDIENVLNRRAPYVKKLLYPASVQGENAAAQLSAGIEYFNKHRVDLIIIARGGGSIEDLWPFNSEQLAYSIFKSKIPVISAVGHETDFTIADFTASVRAPTPSAAAEIASKDVREISLFLSDSQRMLAEAVKLQRERVRKEITNLKQSFYISALAPISRKRDLISFMEKEMSDILDSKLKKIKNFISESTISIERMNPERELERRLSIISSYRSYMKNGLNNLLNETKSRLNSSTHSMEALNPTNVIRRGYALVYSNENKVITSKSMVNSGDSVKIKLKDGSFSSKVTGIEEEK